MTISLYNNVNVNVFNVFNVFIKIIKYKFQI